MKYIYSIILIFTIIRQSPAQDVDKNTFEKCFYGIYLYSQSINQNANLSKSILKKALCYYKLNDFDNALLFLGKFIDIEPNSYIGFLLRGITYYAKLEKYSYIKFNSGEVNDLLQDPINELNQSIKLNPNYQNSYIYSAIIKFNILSHKENAVIDMQKDLNKAFKINKKLDASIYWLKGGLYNLDGEGEKAIKCWDKSISMSEYYKDLTQKIVVNVKLRSGPSYAPIEFKTELINVINGNIKKRKYNGYDIEHFDEISFHTDNEYNGALIDGTRIFKIQVDEIDKILNEDSTIYNSAIDSDVLAITANKFFEENNYQYVIGLYSQLLKIFPNSMEYYYRKAIAYKYLKLYDFALIDLGYAIKSGDQSELENLYLIRGKIFLEKENIRDAINDFNQVILINSNNADAYYYLGISSFSASGFTTMDYIFDCFDKAIYLDPSNADYYYTRARANWILASNGYYNGNDSKSEIINKLVSCIYDINKSIELNPDLYSDSDLILSSANNILTRIKTNY